MINSNKVKERMKKKNVTQKAVADAWHLAKPTVSQKINNVRPMWLGEAEVLAKLLELDDEEFGEYFFAEDIA